MAGSLFTDWTPATWADVGGSDSGASGLFAAIPSAAIPWANCEAVVRSADRVSGAWVFRGTRVPVSALLDTITDGAGLADFLDWFPGVSLVQAEQALAYAASTLKSR